MIAIPPRTPPTMAPTGALDDGVIVGLGLPEPDVPVGVVALVVGELGFPEFLIVKSAASPVSSHVGYGELDEAISLCITFNFHCVNRLT